jgi:hypothetical protein
MADYAPPTLDQLYALVGRDLTDPGHAVFNTSQLADYINGGISEVNRVRPLESFIPIAWDVDLGLVLGPIGLEDVFLVELTSSDGHQRFIPHASGPAPTRDGWDYFARTLMLGPLWMDVATRKTRDEDWSLVLWGYKPRDPLIDDADVAEFIDLNDEMAVRLYCRLEAYRSLNADRGLFQQWQMQANNSDVSPTQLNGMLSTAEGSFDRQQRRIFTPRRIPAL